VQVVDSKGVRDKLTLQEKLERVGGTETEATEKAESN